MAETDAEWFANSHLLVSAMGRWPSFHDANVKTAVREGDAWHVVIHVFEITNEADAAGYLVLTKHHLVTMRLVGLSECTLPSTYEGDCLFGLGVERVGNLIKVVFDSAIDSAFDWHVLCRQAEI